MLRLREVWQRRWPIAVLVGAPLILLAPLVLTGRVLYWGVPLLQFQPWQRLAVESYRAGQLPLWNSLVGSGAPLAANLQTGAFYPLNFLYLLLPTEYAMGYTAVLHVVLAGLFMYAYLRAIKLVPLAALIGALAFAMCGFFIARLAFFSVTAAFPWLAAWLWRAEQLHEARSKRQEAIINALWLALVIGLGVLAGHAQTAVYGLVFVSTYFVWRTLSDRASRHRSIPRSFSLFVVAMSLGLGLAAMQLLPAAELTHESQRAAGLEASKIFTHSYWPPRLLTLFSPDYFGNPADNNFWGYDNYWENAAYIGLIPLLLALWVIWRWWRTRRTTAQTAARSTLIPFFALAAIFSLVLAVGWFTPLYPFLTEHVPGFGLFQGPARWLVVTEVALCVLAGLGMQVWLDHGFSRRAARRVLVIGLALTLSSVWLSVALQGDLATFGPATLRLGVLLFLAGVLFQAAIHWPTVQALLVGIVALDLITAHFALNPVLPPDIYRAPNPTAEALRADGSIGRTFYFDVDEAEIKFDEYLAHNHKFDGYGPNELDYWLGERAALLPNAGLIDGVPSANNFDSLIVGRYQTLLDTINRLSLSEALPILSWMHVGYIISSRELNLPIVYRTPDVAIYRNDQVWPRAWLVPADSDLAQTVEMLPLARVESLTDSGNTVTIRAASPAPAWLILADVWYPGWQASVDGAPTEVRLANGAFRAVRIPEGSHTIEFRYEARSVQWGALITLGSLLVIGAGLALSILWKRREV